MNLKISYILCLVFSVLLHMGDSNAQGVKPVLERADSLLAAGEVYSSNTLYRRLAYFSDSTYLVYIHKQLVRTYKMLDSFSYAFYYSKMLMNEDDDSVAVDWALEAFANGLASSDPDDWNDLVKLEEKITEEKLPKQKYLRFVFYKALLDIKLNQVNDAAGELEKLVVYLEAKDSVVFVQLLDAYREQGVVNIRKAQNLSLIFPGLGQFYLHKPKSAVNSIIINGVVISGLVFTVINYTWVDGLLFWAIPLNHYYIGGARAAGELGKEKQKEVTTHFYNAFIQLLSRAQIQL